MEQLVQGKSSKVKYIPKVLNVQGQISLMLFDRGLSQELMQLYWYGSGDCDHQM